MKGLTSADWIAVVLTLVGGLNWGLVGFFQYDLVTQVLGVGMVTNIVFGLVGLSSLYLVFVVKGFSRK